MPEKLRVEAEIAARDAATPELARAGRGFQGLGSIMDRFVITAGDVVNVLGSVRDSIEGITTQQRTLGVFREQLKAAGEDFETFTEQTRAATAGTVSDLEAVAQAAQAIALGIDPQLLPQLFETARVSAAAFGRDTSDALNDVVVGLGRLSPRILDNIGLTIDSEKAYRDMAAGLGVAVEQLTEFEKRQALSIQVIQQGRESFDEYGTALGGLGESIDRVNSFFENQKNRLIENAVEWLNNRELVQQFNEVVERYLGNAPAVADRTKDITEAAKAQRAFMDQLIESWAKLSATQKAVDAETASLLDTLRAVGVTAIPEAEENIEKLNTRLDQLRDLQAGGIITWEQYDAAVQKTTDGIAANQAVLDGQATSVAEWERQQRAAALSADELAESVDRQRQRFDDLSPVLQQVRRELGLTRTEFEQLTRSARETAAAVGAGPGDPFGVNRTRFTPFDISGGTFSVPRSGQTPFQTTNLT